MPSSDGHPEYDANLLSTAPAPTKGMVQSGYATDLLEDKFQPTRGDDLESNRHKSPRHAYVPNRKSSAEGPEGVIRTKLSPSTEKAPFYRTKRGIIILVIIAIVLLAAIIGGAVGGALSKKHIDPPAVATADIGHPQTNAPDSDGTHPRTTTVTIFPSLSSLSPAPPLPDATLPASFTLGIRP